MSAVVARVVPASEMIPYPHIERLCDVSPFVGKELAVVEAQPSPPEKPTSRILSREEMAVLRNNFPADGVLHDVVIDAATGGKCPVRMGVNGPVIGEAVLTAPGKADIIFKVDTLGIVEQRPAVRVYKGRTLENVRR